MSHNIHLFKVSAKDTKEAVDLVNDYLENFANECAEQIDDENPEGVYPGFDYYHAYGCLNVKTELLEAAPDVFSFSGFTDDRGRNWRIHFGTLEKCSKDVLEGNLTVAQLKDDESEYLPNDFCECGCTCLTPYHMTADNNPPHTTHIVMVDFHN